MSRSVVIPGDAVAAWFANPEGVRCVIPVKVDWPELRLTEAEAWANAVAHAAGEPAPFPDRSFFDVEVTRPAVPA